MLLGLKHGYVAVPRLTQHLEAAALTQGVPAECNWHQDVDLTGALGNDTTSNCVAVAAYRSIQIRKHAAQGDTRVPTAAECDALYRVWSPSYAAGNDDGTETAEADDGWCGQGVAYGDQYLDVPILAGLSPRANSQYFRAAIAHFGGLIVDLALPLIAQDQTDDNQPWNCTSWKDPRAAIGSWGSHRVATGRYDGGGLYVATWGLEQPLSWDFLSAYGLAVFVPISRAWLDASGKSPPGFDWQALLADRQKSLGLR